MSNPGKTNLTQPEVNTDAPGFASFYHVPWILSGSGRPFCLGSPPNNSHGGEL